MPKSKTGPALFELYGKGKTRTQPGGAENGGARSPDGVPKLPSSGAVGSSWAGGAETGALGRAGQHQDSEIGEAPGGVGIEGGRLHVALSSRAAAVTVFALLLLACMAFAAGQWVGRRAGWADGRVKGRIEAQRAAQDGNDIEQARTRQPAENLFGDSPSPIRREAAQTAGPRSLPELPRSVPAPAKSTTTWVKGNTYVLIQEFRRDAGQDALRAKEFLGAHGVESEIFGDAHRAFRLYSTQGFNRKDPTQRRLSDQLLERIKRIGKEYFKAGGRYKLEGYFATLKSDTW